MINNQLLEEILYISSENKFINKDMIEKIIDNIICSTDDLTKNKYNGVCFKNVDWSGNVVCSCTITGEINVNYNKLLNELKNKSCLEANLLIIVILFHEIEHLKESSKIMEKNFEAFLLSYSKLDIFKNIASKKLRLIQNVSSEKIYIKLLENKQEKLYMKSYNLNPSERIATINSYKLLFESLKKYENFNKKYRSIFEYINKLYVEQYYMGYKIKKHSNKINVPLIDYFDFIGMSNRLEQFDLNSDDLNIETKMMYGLPIKLQETKKLNKQLILNK